MKITIIVMLTISLIGNSVLVIALRHHPPVSNTVATMPTPDTAPLVKENGRPTTLTERQDDHPFENSISRRVAELRAKGLSEDLIESALVPIMNTHYKGRIVHSGSFDDSIIRKQRAALDRAVIDREELIESLFGERSARRHYNRKPYRFKSSHRINFGFKSEEDQAIHNIVSKVSGVTLDEHEKLSLVDIVQNSGDSRDELETELHSNFDQQRAEQLLRNLEHGYDRAYRLSISSKDELAARSEFAATLHNLSRARHEALNHLKNDDVSEVDRAAGIRAIESQAQKQLLEELGEPGVRLIQLNGW